MNLMNPIFLIPAMAGFIFIIAGFIMLKFPPKKINSLYGYRTNSSMKSQERWDFAQEYSSREMIKSGSILIVASISGLIINIEEGLGVVLALGFMFFIVIVLVIRTEKALKRKFGKE